jgi:hydroxypyruvate isomerase
MRFSANISTLFTALPLPERFAAAAAAGFSAVEMQFPYAHKPAELAAAAKAAGVEVVLIGVPAGDVAAGERGIACIPGRETEFRAAIAQCLTYAGALHCPRVNCLAGNIPEGASPDECWDVLVENLRDAADAFAPRNIELLVEPLNRADNPFFVLNGTKNTLELITAVGKRNFALQFDAYHSTAAGEDACAQLGRNISHIGHIQFSDYPGRGAPGTGSGTLDFAKFFTALSHLPYEGWVGCEYSAPEPDFAWMQDYALSS